MQTQTIQTIENNQTQQKPQQNPLIQNSIKDSIAEIERFCLYLNDRFNLGLNFDNITILISQAHKNTKGYFSPNGFINTKQTLKGLVLNTIHLKSHPYETIAHELAHYYNNQIGVKDCSSNQYHNKEFKKIAMMLLLEVERLDNHGYAYTRETPEFLKMLEDFKPNLNAFHIAQKIKENSPRQKSRLYKWVCDCGFIIRCGDRTLKTVCQYCNSEFMQEDTN